MASAERTMKFSAGTTARLVGPIFSAKHCQGSDGPRNPTPRRYVLPLAGAPDVLSSREEAPGPHLGHWRSAPGTGRPPQGAGENSSSNLVFRLLG